MKKISDLDGFLIDLDGTLYRGKEVIVGAPDFISTIRKKGKKFLILSNNSSMSCKSYQNKLRLLGIDVNVEEILTSTIASIDYLKKNYPDSTVYPVGTLDFVSELHSEGIQITDTNADVVLLGFDTSLTYEKIKTATHMIRQGSHFLATHGDIFCPTDDGFIPDIGTFIPLFEKATGVSPKVIGKPHRDMVESALDRFNKKPECIGIIGDRLYTDIKMAETYGFIGILVLSGETVMNDTLADEVKPDYIFPSVKEIIQVL